MIRRKWIIALASLALAGTARAGRAAQIEQQIIDPEKENVSSSSYYPVVDASPQKLVDNSGLSAPVLNGSPVPAAWPAHDTVLSDMYWSGVEVAPSLEFTLPGTFAVDSLHYWNYNEAGDHGHRDGPARGIQNVTVLASTGSLNGPFTTVGSYQFQEAPGDATYTGITLPLGSSVVARYVKLQVTSNWGGDFSGLAELRFIGHGQAGDVNLDGAVDFTDLLTLAQHYGTTTAATRDQGDLNGDGAINFNDLLVLAQNYGQSLTASQLSQLTPQFRSDVVSAFAQVPEPAGALLATIAAPLLLTRRQGVRSSSIASF